jgi:antitoxin component YwqK of YwqJK toxin-antitoxin module
MEHLEQLVNKIISYSILLLLLAGCNSAEQPVKADSRINISSINLKQVNGVMYLNDKLYSGIIFSLYPGTTDTAEITSYKNGKEHGEWKKFYEKGILKEKREFTNGMKTGEFIAWWENGKQRLHYLFINDEYDGTCREWNEDGLLIKEMNYKKGYEEGTQRCWYENGKIKANYIITGGRRYGLLGTKNCKNVSDSIFKN